MSINDILTIFILKEVVIMKNDNKRIIITVINIVIFIGNAIINVLSNGGVDGNAITSALTNDVAIVSSAGLSMLAFI